MFVEFQKIEFQNYKTIKKGSLDLKDRGVVLIQGINNDKGGSNGAGKSTLENGLLWCLFGRTLVGKETEKEIVPKFIKNKEFKETGGCCVSVFLKRDTVSYIISRYLKSPERKNSSVVWKKSAGGYDEISKCTDKETDALIVDIVGADYQAFVHSNIFSFNNIEPFLMRGDKEKKELILPKYFVDVFKLAYKKCTEEISDVEEVMKKMTEDSLALIVLESEKGTSFNDVVREIEERNKRLGEIRRNIKIEKQNKTGIEEAVEGYRTVLEESKATLKELSKEKDEHDVQYNLWNNKCSEISLLKNKAVTLERDIGTEKLKLEKYKNNDSKAAVKKLAELSETSAEKGRLFSTLNEKKKACEKRIEEKKDVLTEILSTKKGIENRTQFLGKELAVLTQNIAVISSSVAQKNSRAEGIRKNYYSDECKTCPHNKMNELLNTIAEEVRKAKESLIPCEAKKKELEKELKDMGLSNAKTLELEDSCIGQINDMYQEELQPIFDEINIVSRDLHNLKDVMLEVQCTIDNAGKVLEEITKINSSIEIMSEELIDVNDRIKVLAEENPLTKAQEYDESRKGIVKVISAENEAKGKVEESLNTENIKLGTIKERIKNMTDSLNVGDALEKKKAKIEEEIKAAGERRTVLDFECSKADNKLKLLNFWKVGFSPSGIEGFMMDSLVNAMNSLIQKYLGYLSSNTISLTLIPDKKLKSGDTRNKLSEKVENDFGGETYRTNSEGEKRIMDIAILFALKYIYEQMTGTKYNILFMDEAFDTLDAHTCSLVISLINTLEEITSVLVVSHIDAICLEFDTFIKMVKTKRITEIVDENNSD